MANGRTPNRRLPKRTIGVPNSRRGASISQAGSGLLQRAKKTKRIGVVPTGRRAISSGIRKGARRSTSVNVVRRTEFAQRTGKIPSNIGSGEFKFPNLSGSRKQKGLSGFDFDGGGL